MDQWIRAKYERRQFVAKGPMPNPDDIPLPEGVVPIQINGVAAAPKRVAPVIAMPQAAATNLVSIPQGSPLASPSVSQTQVGGAGSPAKPAATNVSSGADDLFEAFQSPPTTSPTPVTTVGGTSKAAAPTSPAQQPSIDLKANIMSLYATAAPNPPPLQQQQPFGAGFAAFQVPSNGTTPSQSFGGASAQLPVSLFSNAPSSGTQPLSSSATAAVQPASLAFAGLYGPGSSSPLRPSTPLMSSSTPPMTMSPTPLVPLSPMRNGSGASFASFSSASASLSNSVTSAASSPTMQTKSSVSDGIPNFGIPQFGSSATAAAAGSQSKKKSDDPFGAFSALSLGSGTGGAQGVAASQQQPSPIGIAGAKPTAGFGGGSTASTSTTDFDLLGDFR
ncbi:hypothetical protein DFJ73DRAFT_468697 [Zopfochytrium polystomum]|nr:hypothetical protein DFJ73DRAFT_468697 [Zopfochytrium polystomum]